MKRLYRIKPIGHYRIWGSDTLGDQFHLTNPRSIGEISCASANSSCDCEIYGEACTLSDFYKSHREYFHLSCEEFPLRINIMAANEDLSIQVHPDKTSTTDAQPEAWYVIHSDGSRLCLGHNWQKKQDFLDAVAHHKLLNGVRYLPCASNDYFYLQPGTVHAVGKGSLIYELTCQSDITYRLYDYERTDESGHKRPLHIEQAAKYIYYPQVLKQRTPIQLIQSRDCIQTVYQNDPGIFTLKKIELHGDTTIHHKDFHLLTVIEGNGTINDEHINKWDTLLQICDTKLHLCGDMTIMAASFKEAKTSCIAT